MCGVAHSAACIFLPIPDGRRIWCLHARPASTYLVCVHAHTLVRAVGRAAVPSHTVLGVTTPKISATPGTFGDFLQELMRAAGYERTNALARDTGVSHANIGRWIDGSATPSVDALRRIAPYLGVRLGDLMIRAGLATREELGTIGAPPPPGPPLPPVLRSIISRLASPSLTERQKHALILHLGRALALFDEMLDEMVSAPREPRMRKR